MRAVSAAQTSNKFWIGVLGLVLLDSMHYIYARLLQPFLSPAASSFYYMTIALLLVALYAAARRRIDWSVLRDNARFFVAIGFLIALATATSFAAVAFVDPGTAAMLAQMGTIFSLALGVFWLKERLGPGEKAGALLAVGGVFMISFAPAVAGSNLLLGTLVMMLSTFSYALHAALVKRQGGQIDFLNFFLFRLLTSCAFLLLFTVTRGELVWPQGREVWLILLVTAVFNVVISRSLYYLVLRRVDLSILTILLTLSPVLTILLSALLFDVRPSIQAFLGGTAVIAGVILVTLSRRRP